MRSRIFQADAGELHALPMPVEGDRAELWIMRPSRPALVMGSSQKPEQFHHDLLSADGVELVGRRSGGGAVFIDPAATVWIDLVAPRTSDWWSRELAENFLMVGRVWQRALAVLGVETELCTTAPVRTEAASLACWAGVGWGELTLGAAKVVGLSARRTRWGTRVQAMAVLNGSSARVGDYLLDAVEPAIAPATVDIKPAELEAVVVASF